MPRGRQGTRLEAEVGSGTPGREAQWDVQLCPALHTTLDDGEEPGTRPPQWPSLMIEAFGEMGLGSLLRWKSFIPGIVPIVLQEAATMRQQSGYPTRSSGCLPDVVPQARNALSEVPGLWEAPGWHTENMGQGPSHQDWHYWRNVTCLVIPGSREE